MFALMMAAFTLTGCEDVPAPYDIPEGGVGGGGETTLPEGTYLEADFTTSLGKFKSESAEGDGSIKWDINYSSACITGYADWDGSGTKTNKAGVTFLVSPEVDLTKATEAYVEINHAMRYENGDINANNSLLITDNYTGDVKTTAWTQIKYPTTGLNGAQFDFVTSKANIPAEFMGKKVVVALRHTCAAKSSTWEVKKLSVLAGKVDETTPDTPVTPGAGEAKGTGTKADPFNSVAANKAASALAAGAESEQEYYIKGKICKIAQAYKADQWGNASFYISDDGTETDKFYCFHLLYLNNEKYTEGKTNIAVGDEVVVCAKIMNYMGNTPETVGNKGYLVELKSNGGTTPDTPEESGSLKGDLVYVAANCGLDNQTALTTLKLSNDITLTFDGGGNNNAPKYYTSGTSFRMYPKNSVKFTSTKKIASVTIKCDNYNGTIYNASGDMTASAGKFSLVGTTDNVTVTGINSTEFTLTNSSTTTGAASQFRIKEIAVTYAK